MGVIPDAGRGGSSRAAANVELLTGDNLSRVVWRLAWPSVVTTLLQFINGVVDMFFVGSLGPSAQAAVGMGGHIVNLLMSASMAVTSGATAIFARYIGAGDRPMAAETARQALMLTLVLSLILAIAVGLGWRLVLTAMGASDGVVAHGRTYLRITAFGVPSFFVLLTLIALFQGLGDMRTPLAIMVVVNGATILGDAVLVRGWGPIPAFGVAGAATASTTARVAGAALAAYWLARTGVWRWGPGTWRPRRDWFTRILRIGNPAALQGLLRNLGGMTYTRILTLTPEGTAAVAAYFIGLRAEGLGYMPGVAYGRAATTLVGQNLGAGQPERAERSGWLCTWQSLGIITAMSVLFFVLAPWIGGLFSDDPRVVALTTSYLQVNAVGEPFLAFAIVLSGALQGAGDTRFNALVSVISMWLLRLPLTQWLCLDLRYGAVAAWWVMAGTTVVQGLLLAFWFRLGRWKSTRV